MAEVTVVVTGDDYQIERLVAGLAERGAVDIEIIGGHGRNREYHPFLGMRVVTNEH